MCQSSSILIVDDEPLALKYFVKLFGGRFGVHAASSVGAALGILESHAGEIGIVVSDQRMPGGCGLDLLKHVRSHFPETVGILTTAYTEVDTLVQAINAGAVFSFVSKPWRMEEMECALERALAAHKERVLARTHQTAGPSHPPVLDQSIASAGFIASKIGHYVHNAFCPVSYLIDQLIENHRTCESLPLDFLQGLKKHVTDVVSTLRELEKVNRAVSSETFSTINMEQVLDGVLRETSLMREQKQLRIETQIQGLIPLVRGVAPQIEKMFRFMIAEELVSLPPGSRVSVRLSSEEKQDRGPCVKLEFEDYFPLERGMSAENLLHPFHLRGPDPKQFGVFLTSCYLIARNHGGRLTTEIKNDDGLVYSILLPTNATGFCFTH